MISTVLDYMCPEIRYKSYHLGNKQVIRKTGNLSVKINDSDSG
jgi:hypothetical protein